MEDKENINAEIPHGIVKDKRQPLQTLNHDNNVRGASSALKQNDTTENKAQLRASDPWIQRYLQSLDKDYIEDCLSYMLSRERLLARVPVMPRYLRVEIINWLIEITGSEANPAIIQVACWYLDSYYLTIDAVQPVMTKLIALASLWIAHKLHHRASTAFKPRSVSYLPQSTIAVTEKRIMRILGFPVQPTVPQDYIPYLVWYSEVQGPEEIERAATFICITGIMILRRLCRAYPSVIASAAVINALTKLRGMEGVQRILESPLCLSAEKKKGDILAMCKLLMKAGYRVGESTFPYKAPIDKYGSWPQLLLPRAGDGSC